MLLAGLNRGKLGQNLLRRVVVAVLVADRPLHQMKRVGGILVNLDATERKDGKAFVSRVGDDLPRQAGAQQPGGRLVAGLQPPGQGGMAEPALAGRSHPCSARSDGRSDRSRRTADAVPLRKVAAWRSDPSTPVGWPARAAVARRPTAPGTSRDTVSPDQGADCAHSGQTALPRFSQPCDRASRNSDVPEPRQRDRRVGGERLGRRREIREDPASGNPGRSRGYRRDPR